MALNKFSLNTSPAARFIAAAFGGLLLSASFPSLGMAWAAWLAPGIILFSGLGAKSGRAFRIGFVGGFVHFLSSLYWLINMPFTWHGIPIAPAAAWAALSAYCALYPAIWVWLCWKILPEAGGATDKFAAISWVRRLGWASAAGAIWTALEFVRGEFLTGFPWNFVGASQWRVLPLIQVASVTGIYGVSFLVVWVSVSLFGAFLALSRRPAAQRLWAEAGIPLLAVAGVASFGAGKLAAISPPGKELKVAFVQPSIAQTMIWDPAGDKVRFQSVLDLSERALASNPQLLLWPESAVPDLSPEIQQSISQLVQKHAAWLLFCAGTAEPAADGTPQYFNSALLCNPDGALEGGIYHKRRLVIFGEYIPLVRWLPFLKWLTPIGGEVTPGDHPVQFEMRNPPAKMSILICFEDMFAQEGREHVGPDTDFLVNLTDDGWFGHVAEQWQQAATGIFRAVENGVPLLRCTNDGLTCWADAQGRVRQILDISGNVYGPGFIVAQIPIHAPGDHDRTFYNQHGDWFPWSCAGVGLAWLAAGIWTRKNGGTVLK
jgi:apolipoprotein N-acyltransferase